MLMILHFPCLICLLLVCYIIQFMRSFNRNETTMSTPNMTTKGLKPDIPVFSAGCVCIFYKIYSLKNRF